MIENQSTKDTSREQGLKCVSQQIIRRKNPVKDVVWQQGKNYKRGIFLNLNGILLILEYNVQDNFKAIMNNYFQSSLNYYLTDIIMFICSFASFIICFQSRKKSKEFRILYLYPLGSFIIQLSLFITYLTIEYNKYSSVEIKAEKIFLIIEFICIYDFFKTGLKIGRAHV